MKHFKFILPAMVFVMAIGMSFASISLEKEVQSQYIATPNGCQALNPPVACDPMGGFDCQVESISTGEIYDVYDNSTCRNPSLKNTDPAPIPIS